MLGSRGALRVAAGLIFAAGLVGLAVLSAGGGLCGPGRAGTSFARASEFLTMWLAMVATMAAPVVLPALERVRALLAGGRLAANRVVAIVAAGYFAVWGVLGVLVAGIGAAAALWPMGPAARSLLVGLAMVAAGGLQFLRWKRRWLEGCRAWPTLPARPSRREALGVGLRLGRNCVASCAGPMGVLFLLGTMDLVAMLVVTAAMAAERLAPAGMRITELIGAILAGGGLLVVAETLALA